MSRLDESSTAVAAARRTNPWWKVLPVWAKQEFLLRDGDLWETAKVIEKVSELLKIIKMQARLGGGLHTAEAAEAYGRAVRWSTTT